MQYLETMQPEHRVRFVALYEQTPATLMFGFPTVATVSYVIDSQSDLQRFQNRFQNQQCHQPLIMLTCSRHEFHPATRMPRQCLQTVLTELCLFTQDPAEQ